MLHKLQLPLQLYNLHELESTPQIIFIDKWRRVNYVVVIIILYVCIIYYPNFIVIQVGYKIHVWII